MLDTISQHMGDLGSRFGSELGRTTHRTFAARVLGATVPGLPVRGRRLRRAPRRGAALVIAIVLGGAIVAHHAMPMEMHATPMAAICFALAIGGLSAAAGAGASRFIARRFSRVLTPMFPTHGYDLALGIPARASPLFLELCSIRR